MKYQGSPRLIAWSNKPGAFLMYRKMLIMKRDARGKRY